ncbi:hypothetical protein K469DRAFT_704992 [Zopfia rhizophila CBS 207.26]|uniref:Uncharacterized protein n=1 Tax=Zopfia rhizophila CBS 207.26 TaxID=1314779 RepID=A0A6A6EAY7_9PEZI|nr:hypothetical protein K469DRAFT_704992 [Zopfia rhizophila CBS 207.26]
MVDTDGIYKNIDWNHEAATDFWGPASGDHRVPDNTRKEIQRKSLPFSKSITSHSTSWLTSW